MSNNEIRLGTNHAGETPRSIRCQFVRMLAVAVKMRGTKPKADRGEREAPLSLSGVHLPKMHAPLHNKDAKVKLLRTIIVTLYSMPARCQKPSLHLGLGKIEY
jgi:hypothetical protein